MRTEITRALCRRRIGEALHRGEKFGDLITKSSTRSVNQETITGTLSLFKILLLNGFNPIPCKTKTLQETKKSLRKFFEPSEKPKIIYTDNSLEFGKSCEDLSWNHRTSTLHRFPVLEEHLLDYLALRVQEPCTRNALKCTLGVFVFLEEVSELSPPSRLTVRPRYQNTYAELLSQTRPGVAPRQAPRPLLRVLEAMERTVVDVSEAVYIRLFAFFYLLQTWCSLSFSRWHEGVSFGPDKSSERKTFYLDKGCWLGVNDWCDVGYSLLQHSSISHCTK